MVAKFLDFDIDTFGLAVDPFYNLTFKLSGVGTLVYMYRLATPSAICNWCGITKQTSTLVSIIHCMFF